MATITKQRRRPDDLRTLYGKPAAPFLEGDEYPKKWRQYIGQGPAVEMLQVASASARMRKAALDHTLIAHPSPGIGKTALAYLVSAELRRPARIVSGKITVQKARMILAEMNDRDLLVVDEAHRMAEGGAKNAEWMLHLLQDGVLMGPLGPEVQPKITVIAVTTHPQKLPSAVIDRFMLVPPLREYSTDEAARIAQGMGPRILGNLPRLNKAEATLIARAAGNNPRSIKKLLIALRDVTTVQRTDRYDVQGMLRRQGVTEDGLTPVAQQYLQVLQHEFDGAAGVKALEGRLQQPAGLTDVERVLMERGLIARTRSGRELTQAGIARCNELAAF